MTYKTPRLVKATPDDEDSGRTQTEVDTDTYEHPSKKAQTVSRDAWLNGKLIKLIAIIYGLASPFVVWLVITLYGHTTEIALQKLKTDHLAEKLAIIERLNTKIDEINSSINKIQIDISILKTKANIP